MNKSRGRRPGSPDTRGIILEVARGMFRSCGYSGTTMRAVAAEAGVDAALVSYFFGSKHGLFAEAMTLTVSPAEVMQQVFAGGRGDLANGVAEAVLRAWGDPDDAEPLRHLVLSLFLDPASVPTINDYLTREILGPLAAVLGGDQKARAQAAVVVMLISGVVISRQLIGADALTAISDKDVHALVSKAVEAVIAAGPR